jgi:hypothetical protein
MGADITRDTLASATAHRVASVVFQQGRPLVDAELNEQGRLYTYYLRTLISDLVGRSWRPNAAQFSVTLPTDKGFTVTAGHFYVDGLLCVNDTDITYTTQPAWPPPEVPLNTDPTTVTVTSPFMVYLEAWERFVSAVHRTELREVAIAPIDGAGRQEIVWQVRVGTVKWATDLATLVQAALTAQQAAATAANPAPASLAQQLASLPGLVRGFTDGLQKNGADSCQAGARFLAALDWARPRLAAYARQASALDDPCLLPPTADFRGRENQLYRVEVHMAGDASKATFKWSRENASVQFRIRSGAAKAVAADGSVALTVPLESLGHDSRTGLCEGQWVELTSDQVEFSQTALPLGKVTAIDRSQRSVTLQIEEAPANLTAFTRLVRWDQSDGVDADGTLAVTESTPDQPKWLPLERGVQVRFDTGGVYRTGDYWLIPARVATGDIEWAQTTDANGKSLPAAVPPDGVDRHRAPLAFATKTDAAGWRVTPCGCSLQPLCPSA